MIKDIYIQAKDIENYVMYSIMFNSLFPEVLEKSNLMIWVENGDDGNVEYLSYKEFIAKYDSHGLAYAD